jgi:[ribosomal protein S18]-alanine N-acetyltransferase
MHTTDVTLRRADPAEAMELAAIGYAAWETSILPLSREQEGTRQHEQRRLIAYCNEAISRIVVADIDGEAVGWCSRARARPYIPYLFVAPAMQNRGIGSLLLERVETILELHGARYVQLETPADHVRAVQFYEHNGYNILAMKPDGRGAHKPFMSVWLEKRLSPFTGNIDV